MGAVLPVIGLLRRHGQQFVDERKVEVQQECSVKKQEVFAAALGIAGKFAFVDDQVRMTPHRNCGLRTPTFVACSRFIGVADCGFTTELFASIRDN